MKKILSIVLALCSAVLLQAAKVNKEVTIKVGNDTRKYWLYVPTNVKENCPFVLSLHGAGGHDTDKSPFRTDVADKAGCIVAYPQGKDTKFLQDYVHPPVVLRCHHRHRPCHPLAD